MGGRQSLDFRPDSPRDIRVCWQFSCAPNTRLPQQLVPDADKATKMLKLLWISGGARDGLLTYSQRTHAYLKEHNVPHVYNVDPGAHDFDTWNNNLYLLFALRFPVSMIVASKTAAKLASFDKTTPTKHTKPSPRWRLDGKLN